MADRELTRQEIQRQVRENLQHIQAARFRLAGRRQPTTPQSRQFVERIKDGLRRD
jgi:hypothetical protein